MTSKPCPHCGVVMDFSYFGMRANGSPQSWCKACVREAGRRRNVEPVDVRVPYVPPTDFLAMPPPLERVALVYPVGYRVAA